MSGRTSERRNSRAQEWPSAGPCIGAPEQPSEHRRAPRMPRTPTNGMSCEAPERAEHRSSQANPCGADLRAVGCVPERLITADHRVDTCVRQTAYIESICESKKYVHKISEEVDERAGQGWAPERQSSKHHSMHKGMHNSIHESMYDNIHTKNNATACTTACTAAAQTCTTACTIACTTSCRTSAQWQA